MATAAPVEPPWAMAQVQGVLGGEPQEPGRSDVVPGRRWGTGGGDGVAFVGGEVRTEAGMLQERGYSYSVGRKVGDAQREMAGPSKICI